jgi:hypothetical protein
MQTKEKFFSANVGSLADKKNPITEMLNMIVVQQRNFRIGDERFRRADELATELINDLKEEYHLK